MTEELKERTTDEEWLLAEGFDLGALASKAENPLVVEAGEVAQVDPRCYQRCIVAFSGGKDSMALLLHLLEMGVPRERIELHHHLVDGREGSTLMDWPVTEGYCEAIARAFGVSLTYSWREGGIEKEMNRDGDATAAVFIPDGNGHRKIGGEGPPGTRLKFPQVSADLSVRWCSGVSKIDCFARYLNNHPKFTEGRTLVLTGERAEESSARSKYRVFEPHKCDLRNGRKVKRHIDVWRAVHGWSEQKVWDIMKRWKVCAHPSYWLMWSRMSCRLCSQELFLVFEQSRPSPICGEEKLKRATAGSRRSTSTFWVAVRLLGFLPFGKQAIVISFPQSGGGVLLRDNGHSALVKVWDQTISITSNAGRTRYKDSVIIDAGLLTLPVWLFAQAFYRHRQRRWRLLARRLSMGEVLPP